MPSDEFVLRQVLYAPNPIMQVDENDVILDINLAARLLLGDELIGRPGFRLPELIEHFHFQGRFPEQDGALNWNFDNFRIASAVPFESTFSLTTGRFGRVVCEGFAVPMIGMTDGIPHGFTWSWNIREIGPALDQAYRDQLRASICHQLLWDTYASIYDRILPELLHYQQAIERHVRELSQSQCHTILDVGAGTGNLAMCLLTSSAQVTAVDVSRSMLSIFRSKLSPDLKNVPVILEQSAEKLPQFEDSTFDAVTSLLALYDMNDGRSALSECVRVLRSGGTLVVTEPKPTMNIARISEGTNRCIEAHPRKDELRRYQDRLREIGRHLANERAKSGLNSGQIIEILKQHGMMNIRTIDSHYGECQTIAASKP